MLAFLDLNDWSEEDITAYLEVVLGDQDALLALHYDGPLPEPHSNRPSVIVIVPGTEPVVPDDDPDPVDLERTARLAAWRAEQAERELRQRQEEAARKPLAFKDWDPDGDPDVIVYYDAGYPVTRTELRRVLGR